MNKYKPYLWPFTLILVSILMVFFVILPAIEQINVTRNEVSELTEKKELLATKAAILEKSDDQLLKSDLIKAETALPSDKNLSGMIFGLETLAASTSAHVDSFSTNVGKLATDSAKPVVTDKKEESKLGNKVEITPFSMEVSADFDPLNNYLRLLGGVNRLVGISSIAWEERKASIVLDVFYQPLVKTLGAITTPVYELTTEDRNLLRQVSAYPLATPQTTPLPIGKSNPFVGN